ncbi:ArsC family reductase [Vibrio sp. HA2012]|uniref:ArsC family reductase n=1 Tax=Vibrio sp. HA2012 TaxID=1971595 RepID=UPI000C2C585E|nr:ArsC family reductase [Vibrio sp. HA2012]PJC86582.1 ArsC family reductase [Vibrio sp. HA2012]
MTVTLYGIPNCDTIKKARKWLEQTGIDYQFHDYRKQGVDRDMVSTFCHQFGWEQVLNKRGTTYRQLTQEQKETLNESAAIALLTDYPAMIKRPVLQIDDQYYLGFKAEHYSAIFNV